MSLYMPLKHIGVGRVLEVKLHLFSNMERVGAVSFTAKPFYLRTK
jgi:hypothetical protein